MNEQNKPRIEKVGRRWYAMDFPRSESPYLKDKGSWDPERRGWWTGRVEVARSWEERLAKLQAAGDTPPAPSPVEQAHAEGLCTWTRLGVPNGRWFVTGPEAVLRQGSVRIVRKGKPPEEIRVENVRQVGGQWIADKIDEEKPRKEAESRRSIALVGTKEGATETRASRQRERPHLESLVGDVVPAKDGYLLILGAEAQYTSADEEEDLGQPGIGANWWVRVHVRPATEAESAPAREAAAARDAELWAKEAAAEAKARVWAETLARHTGDKERVSVLPAPTSRRMRIADFQDGSTYIELSSYAINLAGERFEVVGQHISSGDMMSEYTWAPRELALRLLDAEIARRGLTREQGLEFLAKYTGCVGTDIHRRAAGLDPWTGEG